MTIRRKALRREKHKYFRFVDMWSAAKNLLERAKAPSSGGWYPAMASVCFCAFCLEAFLNHVGAKRIRWWAEAERSLTPKAKLLAVADHLGVEISFSKEPWQSFQKAFKTRNLLAHAKTEIHEPTPTMADAADDGPVRAPDLELEELTTLKSAERILSQTKKAVLILWDRLGETSNPFLFPTSSEVFLTTKEEEAE